MDNIFRINEENPKREKLDVKDMRILSSIAYDCRTPTTVIAKQARLSTEACHYRIKSLVKKGVILGFYPIIDLRQLGYYTFHVFFLIDDHDPSKKRELFQQILAHPSTRSVIEYADRWDLEWSFIARSVQEFDDIMNDVTSEFGPIILEKKKFELIRGFKSIQFPDPYSNEHPSLLPPKKAEEIRIEKVDLDLLYALCEDSRASCVELGKKIKMSTEGTRYRLARLKKSGLVRQFSIIPNLTLIGYNWNTLCVDVKTFDYSHELKLKEYLSQRPNVIRAVKTLGDWDLMLHVVTKSVSELHKTVKDFQRLFTDVTVSISSWGAFKEHYFTSLPKRTFNER